MNMFKQHRMALALRAAFCLGGAALGQSAHAAESGELSEIRAQIQQMRSDYEARLNKLEQRLQEALANNDKLAAKLASPAPLSTPATPTTAPAVAAIPAPPPPRGSTSVAAQSAPPSGAAMSNLFNPAVSLILTGTYANLSQDPKQYRLQGFIPPGGETGPGQRGFGIGESELTLAAAIDPHFSGQLTFALDGKEAAGVEEAFVSANNLGSGLNLKFGRFYSGLGYQNGQHAHVWDFADLPLAYQALLGGQTTTNGLQLKWLAPLDKFVEFGAEIGDAGGFPGSDDNHNGIGSALAFVHLGDDIGDNGSWRAGLSYLHSRAVDRRFDDGEVSNGFTGKSRSWIADAVFKYTLSSHSWLKLQGEYIRRNESGALTYDVANPVAAGPSADYRSSQSGWYVQGIYQFHPAWRVGLRHDRLNSGNVQYGALNDGRVSADQLPIFAAYNPRRTGLLLDWNGSEFSRIRFQVTQDKSRPGVNDHQIHLQYIMSLGAHGAHSF
jgi:hypothetical protein